VGARAAHADLRCARRVRRRVHPARAARSDARGRDVAVGAARALEQAGELVLEWHRRTLLDANETALQALGLGREDFGRRRWAQIDCELADGELARMVERLRANGAERRETSYASRRRRARCCGEVIAQRAGRGRRESILLLARDIGERKRANWRCWRAPSGSLAVRREPVALLLLDENLRVLQSKPRGEPPARRALIDLVGAEVRRCSMRRTPRPRRGCAATCRPRRCARTMPTCAWCRRTAASSGCGWSSAAGRAERSRRFLLVLEDHTERKLAAMQLQDAVAQQRTLLETMSAAWRGCATAGWSRQRRVRPPVRATANGRSPLAAAATGRERRRRPARRAVAGGLRRLDGASRRCWSTPPASRSGAVQARAVQAGEAGGQEAIYTFQDVSAQREGREALARSLIELNLVFDSTAVALLHLAEGRIVRCNAQAATMLGGADGPIGRRFAELLEPSAEEPAPAWLDSGAPASAAPVEARMLGADGVPFWRCCRCAPSTPSARPPDRSSPC